MNPMKFVRYSLPKTQAPPVLGVLTANGERIMPVEAALGKVFDTLPDLIERATAEDLAALSRAAEPGAAASIPVPEARLLAPIGRPLHDILCAGENYRAHREEMSASVPPPKTVFFSKRALRLLGPGESLPLRDDIDESLDYESELAVIIGRRGADIPPERAEDYIFGYSIFNDLTYRRHQKEHGQWFKGKSVDGCAALGPVVLHRSALPFPVEVDVLSRVNGEERQHSNTSLLLTPLPELIAQLSRGMTLEPGDIIATGTPAGVGAGFSPPRFLRRGDRVVCEIPPIGALETVVE